MRIGVAIDADLLGQFDELISKRSYGSRSEAFRDPIRDALISMKGVKHGRLTVTTAGAGHDR